jgi:hypothetical protein
MSIKNIDLNFLATFHTIDGERPINAAAVRAGRWRSQIAALPIL